MMDSGNTDSDVPELAETLREDLRQGDLLLGAVGPILRHMLANPSDPLFSDETIAQVRGMVHHVAYQLLFARAEADPTVHDCHAQATRNAASLAELLYESPALLTFCHALAFEWKLARRLHEAHGIDPVGSSLLQSLIASSDDLTAEAAMSALAAQARFSLQQERMEIPLGELPGELFHGALLALRAHAVEELDEAAATAETRLRGEYDESRSRLALIGRLVTAMGSASVAALSIAHAGVSIFTSALAVASRQDRALVLLSIDDRQTARLALTLRAAGLSGEAMEEQFLYLHPELAPPDGCAQLPPNQAVALLAASFPNAGA